MIKAVPVIPDHLARQVAAVRQRSALLAETWDVADLPEDFDRSDPRFRAAHLKWELDRDGQDWPRPQYVRPLNFTAPGHYMLYAEIQHDAEAGCPVLWAVEIGNPNAVIEAAA